jgi:hypothetical protein
MFDNIKPIDKQWEHRKKLIWIAIAVFIVVAPLLYYEFKNWPEEHAAKAFLTALQEERYQEAYTLWHPASLYTMADFQSDWGKQSSFGKVNSFKITKSHERGSGVIITVSINDGKEARIWVEKKDKSLGFPPY